MVPTYNTATQRLQLSRRRAQATNQGWSSLMASPLSDDNSSSSDNANSLDEAKLQITEAIRDALASIDVLIVQCLCNTLRYGLGEHLACQATHAIHSITGTGRTSVDAYLDLSGYPERPARWIVRGMAGYCSDIAAGLPHTLNRATVLVIDCVEHMLDVMPVRLTRFIQSCVSHRILVVILSASATSVLNLDLGQTKVRMDYILESDASELKNEAMGEALAVIASAAGKRPFQSGECES